MNLLGTVIYKVTVSHAEGQKRLSVVSITFWSFLVNVKILDFPQNVLGQFGRKREKELQSAAFPLEARCYRF